MGDKGKKDKEKAKNQQVKKKEKGKAVPLAPLH